MNEHDFLSQLERRAQEHERLLQGVPYKNMFLTLSLWLGEHPWRLLIPLAILLTLLFRLLLGIRYYELILKLFGGFGILIK